MSAFMPSAARETRKLFAITEWHTVKHVLGYSCAPNNPGCWWCPELGFSGTFGMSFFDSKEKAKAAAITALEKEISSLSKKLSALRS